MHQKIIGNLDSKPTTSKYVKAKQQDEETDKDDKLEASLNESS